MQNYLISLFQIYYCNCVNAYILQKYRILSTEMHYTQLMI